MLAGANADLREQLSGAQAALRAKEAEYSALVLEHDRLVQKLADQEESHKAALKKAQDNEAALKAEFETKVAGWAETRQALNEGFGRIEDLIDGTPPSSLLACPLPPDCVLTCAAFYSLCRLLTRLLRLCYPNHRGPPRSTPSGGGRHLAGRVSDA